MKRIPVWVFLAPIVATGALSAQTPTPVVFTETAVGRVQGLLIDSLQTSPDGRHVAYAIKRGMQTLLALDGAINPTPFEGIGADAITFSPDSSRVAYLAATGTQWTLVDGTSAGKAYDTFAKHSVTFSPDSKHLAAVAERAGKRFVVIDGVEGPAYDDVTSFCFGPLKRLPETLPNARYAYAARTDVTWHVVVDGVENKATYDEVQASPVVFSADGAHLAYAARRDGAWSLTRDGVERASPGPVAPGSIIFSEDNIHVACVVTVAGSTQVLVDGSKQAECDEIAGQPIFGSQLIVVGRRDASWSVLIGGKSDKAYDKITSAVATCDDGKRIGFAAMRGSRVLAVIDGKESDPYDEVLEGPVFSADGKHAGFVARRDHQQFWVIDEAEGPMYDAVGRLSLGPDGHFACGVQRGAEVHLIVDGRPSPTLGGFIRGVKIIFDAKGGCSTIGYRDNALLRIEGRPK